MYNNNILVVFGSPSSERLDIIDSVRRHFWIHYASCTLVRTTIPIIVITSYSTRNFGTLLRMQGLTHENPVLQ